PRPTQNSTLFPYTTLFRSGDVVHETPQKTRFHHTGSILVSTQGGPSTPKWGYQSGMDRRRLACRAGYLADENRQSFARSQPATTDRKSTRLNSSHGSISYA